MEGYVSEDTLSVGGITLNNVSFAEATSEPGTAFLYGKYVTQRHSQPSFTDWESACQGLMGF